MEVKFNIAKEERKALVAAVSELTGCKAVYMKTPTYAFMVGNYTIDRNSTLVIDEQMDTTEVRTLLLALAERGFVCEGDIDELVPVVLTTDHAPHDADDSNEISASEAPGRLAIEVPLIGFNQTTLNNLEKLIDGKAALIMKAIGSDALPIERTETTLSFPWFSLPSSQDEIDAYTRLVCGICELAKRQKRVTMKESGSEPDSSEKFAFRCFLLRLGFIGKEYGSARKILLSRLSGNGSFKIGDHKRGSTPEGTTAADNRDDNGEAINVHCGDNNANKAATDGQNAAPARCSECWYHCYYTTGLLHTKAGDIVDTSNRTPESYTHYCLGAPSGFRKIKNAAEWSGCEAPTKWCPLSDSNNVATVSEVAANE